MKKENLPIVVIAASLVLILVNIFTTETTDNAFWMRLLSSALLILAMVLTIRGRKRREQDKG